MIINPLLEMNLKHVVILTLCIIIESKHVFRQIIQMLHGHEFY